MTTQDDYIKKSVFPGELPQKEGVFWGQDPGFSAFESHYLELRRSEERLYTDEQVSKLPYLQQHVHTNEWMMRGRSAGRVLKYFRSQNLGPVLDLGCGNGWFSNQLSEAGMQVVGMDVNKAELIQAARLFRTPDLCFVYGDIFQEEIPNAYFDAVTLNASVQYFGDLKKLFDRLLGLLKPGGEIHLIDSPFYTPEQVKAARQRTEAYYTKAGFPVMAKFYFHHSYSELSDYHYQILHDPRKNGLFKRLVRHFDIPFPWIKIIH